MGATPSDGDAYAHTARYVPGLLGLAPVGIVVVAAGWQDAKIVTGLLALAGTVGMPILLRSVVRQQGKRYDVDRLPSSEGLWTTTRLLLPDRDDPATDAHNALRRRTVARATGVALPDHLPADDVGRQQAIATIDQAVADLRRRTRDPDAFALLAAENAEYGMWRNLYGFRTVGVLVSLVALVAATGLAVLSATDTVDLGTAALVVAAVVCAALGALWWIVPTQERIRLAAQAYAVALFDAALGLDAPSSFPSSGTPPGRS
jgi:hypothetical protein